MWLRDGMLAGWMSSSGVVDEHRRDEASNRFLSRCSRSDETVSLVSRLAVRLLSARGLVVPPRIKDIASRIASHRAETLSTFDVANFANLTRSVRGVGDISFRAPTGLDLA